MKQAKQAKPSKPSKATKIKQSKQSTRSHQFHTIKLYTHTVWMVWTLWCGICGLPRGASTRRAPSPKQNQQRNLTLYSIQGWSALQVLPLSWARGASMRRAGNSQTQRDLAITAVLAVASLTLRGFGRVTNGASRRRLRSSKGARTERSQLWSFF